MKEWRSRGFVQDSEDEDELSVESRSPPQRQNVRPVGNDAHGSDTRQSGITNTRDRPPSTGDRQGGTVQKWGEASKSIGIETDKGNRAAEEYLSEDELALDDHFHTSCPSRTSKNGDNIDGFMPLSSPPAEAIGIAQAGGGNAVDQTGSRLMEEQLASSPPLLNVTTSVLGKLPNTHVEHELDNDWVRPQRNFRQRKAIQLHPYLILDGRYQKEMRAAGLVPTRVVQMNEQDHGSNSESDSDRQSTFRSPPPRLPKANRPHKPGETSLVHSEPQIDRRQIISSPASNASLQDDDLPALQDLLKHKKSKDKAYIGIKRRKLLHAQRTSIHRQPAFQESSQIQDDLPFDEHPPMLEALVSPTSSARASPDLPRLVGRRGFRFPVGFSPQKPPTPATSSSSNAIRRKLPTAILDSSPATQLPRRQTTESIASADLAIDDQEISNDSLSESSLSSSKEEDDAGQLRVIQRRIKGVLPASWLKLDVEAQERVPNDKREPHSLHNLRDGRQQPGLARRRLKPSTSSRLIIESLTISSDEESEAQALSQRRSSSETQVLRTEVKQRPVMPLLLPDDDPGETMEDNRVDFMLPSASRRTRKKTSGGRNLQTKLTHALDRTAKQPRTYYRNKMHAFRHRDVSNAGPITQTRFKPPKLSILDVMSSSSDKSANIPSFLKIARRQAKRHPDQGRQRPVHKNIRLRAREDTADVHSVLADWRAGKIKQKKLPASSPSSSSPSKRRPLVLKDTNTVQSFLTFDVEDVLRSDGLPKARVTPMTTASRPNEQGENCQSGTTDNPNRVRKRIPPQRPSRVHDGQLEAEEDAMDLLQDRMHFSRKVQRANQDYTIARQTAILPLPRTLAELEDQIRQQSPGDMAVPQQRDAMTGQKSQLRSTRPKRLRKRRPQRVDVGTVAYRQPEEFALPMRERSPSVQFVQKTSEMLQDLNPWGVPYAHDFDILPLPVGTYFHNNTFLGSGNFRRALDFGKRDLDVEQDAHTLSLAGRQCHWAQWNEEISSDVKYIFAQVAANLSSITHTKPSEHQPHWCSTRFEGSIQVLEKMLNANSSRLSFSDPIDRSAFGLVYLNELDELQAILEESKIRDFLLEDRNPIRPLLRLVARLAIVTAQVFVIIKNCAANPELRARCEVLVRRQMELLVSYLMHRGFDEIRTFYDDNQRHVVREAGIKDNQAAVEVVVILFHILQTIGTPGLSFWDAFNANMLQSIDTTTQTGYLEHKWFGIFTVLPLLEVDADGNFQPGQRFQIVSDNWEAIKRLLGRVFALYHGTTLLPGTTINEYVRSLLKRCHHLIQTWAWRKCEAVIGMIFDFFAKQEYMSLHKEDKYGSPRFLEQLASRPSLHILRDEKAFHVFLKIVAAGLFGMRRVYDNKKTRSIVWRWIPNHNRTYDKDKDLRKEDLDALRNQHDLLSTLYWASPAGFRPRIDLIQNLVDHSVSHLEACRINIKTWSNLAAFQLSTDEPVQAVGPLASWLKEVLEQNVSLYKLARPELEAQYEATRNEHGSIISADKLETMISRNQSGTVAAVGDAIAGMRSAIKTANCLPPAWSLLHDSNIQTVFTLFDTKKKKANSVLIEVLLMFDAFLELVERYSRKAEETQTSAEESQDYGEWPEEEDVVAVKGPAEQALEFLLDQDSSLLSNIFGSETSPDDDLLTRMVEHWARLAVILVRWKLAEFETFAGDYGRHSWSQLRDTDQRRKYGPYFFSCLLRQNQSAIEQHREQFFSTWMCCLVEREAQLKFQHSLTSDLLNACPDDPLLKNLPFTRKPESGRYDISAAELRERRLALMSSVLSNMRDEFQRTLQEDPSSIRTLRSEYTSVLNHVMLRMRRNYEEIRQGEIVAGAYVAFVQSMIEFMQQYTADICPVDKYFMDSTAFPLPTNDPTYLVGRLKSYDSKLGDAKMVKQLIVFVQNVSERAAVDNEQGYLITQLASAVGGSFESEQPGKSSLRSVLLQVVFPAYIEASLAGSPAWIPARPLLRVCCTIFKDLLFKFSVTNALSMQATMVTLTTILSSLMKAVSPLEFAPHIFQLPHVLSTLNLILGVATLCIPPLDYIRRRSGFGTAAAEAIKYQRDFTLYMGKILLGRPDTFPPTNLNNGFTTDATTAEMVNFCSLKLQEDFRDKWRMENGRYLVKRGNLWKELHVCVGGLDEEKSALIEKIEAFHEVLDRAKSL